jgi:hypothetical protein
MLALRTNLPTAFALLAMGMGLASCALIVGPIDGHHLFGTVDDGGVDAQLNGQASPAGLSSDAGGADVAVQPVDGGSLIGSSSDGGLDAGSDASFQGMPVYLAKNEGDPQGIAVAAGAVYWSDIVGGTLRTVSLGADGMPQPDAGPTSVFSFANAGAGGATDLKLDGETLYALVGPNATATASCRTYFEMPLSNLSMATCAKPNNVCATASTATRMTNDSSRVFISDGASDGSCYYVMGETKPGTTADTWRIFPGPTGEATALSSDDSYLYYAVNDGLYRQDPTGVSAPVPFYSVSGAVVDLVTDGARAYWITTGANAMVQAANTPLGDMPGTLAMAQQKPQRLAQDDKYIYWTNAGTTARSGSIVMAAKNGSGVRTLAESQANPWGIAVDTQAVYWTNQDDGSVMMLRK